MAAAGSCPRAARSVGGQGQGAHGNAQPPADASRGPFRCERDALKRAGVPSRRPVPTLRLTEPRSPSPPRLEDIGPPASHRPSHRLPVSAALRAVRRLPAEPRLSPSRPRGPPPRGGGCPVGGVARGRQGAPGALGRSCRCAAAPGAGPLPRAPPAALPVRSASGAQPAFNERHPRAKQGSRHPSDPLSSPPSRSQFACDSCSCSCRFPGQKNCLALSMLFP